MRTRTGRALLLAAVLLAWAGGSTRADTRLEARGSLTGDVRWSGHVLLTGDVTVEEGASLTIAEGTQILVSSKATGSGGGNPNLVELHVKGEILAAGSAHRPIRFGFEKEPKKAEEKGSASRFFWLGLVIHPAARNRSSLRSCIFSHAFTGVQVGGDGFLLEDCVFYRCGMGVGTGTYWASGRRRLAEWETSTPRILGCRFAHCYTAVTIEGTARPEVERCVVIGCSHGVANERLGITMGAYGIGAFIDRCTFAHNGVAVHGSSRVVNSIFYRNGTALAPSAFQANYGVSTDRVVRAHNLYFGNVNLLQGDTDLGTHSVFEDPGFAVVPPKTPTLEVLEKSVASLVGLVPDSPAVGRATDGGDLGATGARGSTHPWDIRAESEDAIVLGTWIVLGPAAHSPLGLEESDLRRLGRKIPSPGSLWDEATWGVFRPSGDSSEAARPEFLGSGQRPVWGVSECTALVPGPLELRLGGDCAVEAWWNGEKLPISPQKRRYDPDDVLLPVRARKGRNTLVVKLTPWTEERRFLARLLVPEGEEAAARLSGVAAEAPPTPVGRSISIKKATARRPRKADDRVEGKLLLTSRVHWFGTEDANALEFLTAEGKVVPSPGLELRYFPVRRAIEFTAAQLPIERTASVRIRGLRDPSGHALPPLEAPLRWR